MLTAGETYEQRYSFLWDYIHTCQDLIKTLQAIKGQNEALAREVIQLEREQIKKTYAELKQLAIWFKNSGLQPDEQYYLKKRVENGKE